MAIPKTNQLVGLDIGSHSIKLVEIHHSRKGRVLKNLGLIGLPPEAIVQSSIKEVEIVSSAIRNLFRNLKVKNKNVATSISGFSLIVKKIALGKKGESELEAKIQDEAKQYIPFDINEVNLDFDILTAGGDPQKVVAEVGEKDSSDQMEMVLVAAKKDIINKYVSLLQIAGLNLRVLDVDAFALQNAFGISTEEAEPEGCYALVNVGAEELIINVVRNDVSLFTRDSYYGGCQITEGIMFEFDVGFEEAEKIKLGGTGADKDKGRLEEVVGSVVSEWIQEIKRALDFVANTYPNETIEKLFVSGGSCKVPGFQSALELETDIHVAELNPFANLITNEKHFDLNYLSYMAPQAAVAVGLALRSIGDK